MAFPTLAAAHSRDQARSSGRTRVRSPQKSGIVEISPSSVRGGSNGVL